MSIAGYRRPSKGIDFANLETNLGLDTFLEVGSLTCEVLAVACVARRDDEEVVGSVPRILGEADLATEHVDS